MAGYSGTPLARKIGLKPGQSVLQLGLPPGLAEALTPADASRLDRFEAAETLTSDLTDDVRYDLVHLFTAVLTALLSPLAARISRNGMIWISWPKRASKVPTDLTEDVIRTEALARDLVDVKVCAVDAVWSGLKLVIPLAKR